MKRNIVNSNLSLEVVRITKSQYAEGGYNIIVAGNIPNVPSPKGNGQHSILVTDSYIKRQAVGNQLVTEKGVSLSNLLCAYIQPAKASDQASHAVVEVEERIVGEFLEDEHGNIVSDNNGNLVQFAGTKSMREEYHGREGELVGKKYFQLNLVEMNYSGSFKAKCQEFALADALRIAENSEEEEYLPPVPSNNRASFLAKLNGDSPQEPQDEDSSEETKASEGKSKAKKETTKV